MSVVTFLYRSEPPRAAAPCPRSVRMLGDHVSYTSSSGVRRPLCRPPARERDVGSLETLAGRRSGLTEPDPDGRLVRRRSRPDTLITTYRVHLGLDHVRAPCPKRERKSEGQGARTRTRKSRNPRYARFCLLSAATHARFSHVCL
eukprot:355064-Prymnesium_polylepis.3